MWLFGLCGVYFSSIAEVITYCYLLELSVLNRNCYLPRQTLMIYKLVVNIESEKSRTKKDNNCVSFGNISLSGHSFIVAGSLEFRRKSQKEKA